MTSAYEQTKNENVFDYAALVFSFMGNLNGES